MRTMIGKCWKALGTAGKCDGGHYYGVRTMVGKASNRAGVHGSRIPDAKALDNEEEIRERIDKGGEDKEQKRREVEKKVSQRDVVTLQAYLSPLGSQSIIHSRFLQIPWRRQSCFSKHLNFYSTGLSKAGKLDEAVVTLIEKSSSSPSNLSSPEAYTDVLHACISARSLHHGQKICALVLNDPSLRHDPKLLSKLITLFSVCRRLDLARKIFDDVTDSAFLTEEVWAAMAIGYSRNGSPRDALLAYVDMLCSFIEPGDFSISIALKACIDLKDLRVGRGIHAQKDAGRENRV
ncbi:unnamed protein product [Thlaspi arvense]|uniref:Pentatricopeptide repeat-containing protein n=1 Tax=Thlaspi arvense TaxID=13288 RepID=A0AAU9RYX6_THLAR|nr:unnamed protein product [Thlaspi arvense]